MTYWDTFTQVWGWVFSDMVLGIAVIVIWLLGVVALIIAFIIAPVRYYGPRHGRDYGRQQLIQRLVICAVALLWVIFGAPFIDWFGGTWLAIEGWSG